MLCVTMAAPWPRAVPHPVGRVGLGLWGPRCPWGLVGAKLGVGPRRARCLVVLVLVLPLPLPLPLPPLGTASLWKPPAVLLCTGAACHQMAARLVAAAVAAEVVVALGVVLPPLPHPLLTLGCLPWVTPRAP